MVPSTTSWGVRRYCSRPRRAMPRVLAGRPAERRTETGTVAMVGLSSQAAGWPAGTGWAMPWPGRARNTPARGGGRRVVDAVGVQGQEHLGEGRGPQGDVVARAPGRVQGAQGVAQPVAAGLDADADPAGRLLDLRLAVVEGGQSGGDSWQVGLVAHVDLDDVAAGPLLELAGGAGGDGPAVVDD